MILVYWLLYFPQRNLCLVHTCPGNMGSNVGSSNRCRYPLNQCVYPIVNSIQNYSTVEAESGPIGMSWPLGSGSSSVLETRGDRPVSSGPQS